MRGHERLIDLRRAGKVPRMVFVNDWACATDWFEDGNAVTICTDGDVIQLLDLRFLVGLRVSISAKSEIRAKALFEQCRAAGAAAVAACHVQDDRRHWEQSGWSQVWVKPVQEVA